MSFGSSVGVEGTYRKGTEVLALIGRSNVLRAISKLAL